MTRKGCKESEESKKKRITAMLKYWDTHPEIKEERSRKMSGDNNPSKRVEVRIKHSNNAKIQWSDPLNRKKQSDIKKEYYSNNIHREEQSNRVKKIRAERPETCYWKMHPEITKENYKKLKAYKVLHPEIDKAQSERMKINNPSNLPEVKEKLSNRMKCRLGPDGTNWKGGKSFEPYCHKFNNQFKEYIRNKFSRRCFICNKEENTNCKKLFVHHIDYNKVSICNGKSWAFVPLCNSCHSKTNGNRWYWFNLLINYWVLNEDIWFDQFAITNTDSVYS